MDKELTPLELTMQNSVHRFDDATAQTESEIIFLKRSNQSQCSFHFLISCIYNTDRDEILSGEKNKLNKMHFKRTEFHLKLDLWNVRRKTF